jgi:hypothetical protein
MFQSETQNPADSEALGFDAVLRRVHEPVFESLFWLALGCVLGWQDKKCIQRSNTSEAVWYDMRKLGQ